MDGWSNKNRGKVHSLLELYTWYFNVYTYVTNDIDGIDVKYVRTI